MNDGADRSVQVDVQYAGEGDDAPAESDISDWIRSAVRELDMEDFVEVSVRIVDETEGRELNRNYRNKDYATNVLSFPAGDSVLPEGVPRPLGDIVICSPVVRRESEAQGKALADHWAHMLVHGTLHLLGFDHEVETEADEMEAIEKRILAAGGVGDPYAA